MKKLFFTIALMLCATFVFSQDTEPDKGSGVCYFSDYPATTPSANTSECEFAINTAVPEAWVYSRSRSEWIPLNNFNFGFGAPSGSPESNGFNGLLYVDRSSGKIYQWTTDWNLIAGTNIQKYPNSSPALLVNGDSLSLDLELLNQQDVEKITSRIISEPSVNIALVRGLQLDSLSKNQIQSIAESIVNDSTAKRSLTDSLTQRIVERLSALEIISSNSQQEKNELIVNSSGADIFVKYTGVAPTYTGNLGIFTLSFDIDSTKVKSWRFGGGTAENVWDGSGDLQLNVTLTNSSPTLPEINAIFGNIQMINAGNGEVLSDPKGQLQVTIFQERTTTSTVQIRASNLTGFDTDGFKMVATY